MTATAKRSEHDLLGDRDVPTEAYWGIHTLRATENFPITGTSISTYPHLINALAADGLGEPAAVLVEHDGERFCRPSTTIPPSLRASPDRSRSA